MIYFLDFEASSLDEDSYPIEIGWVDENGQGESYLIQPHWSWSGWSIASEGIHHITQDMLSHGTDAVVVARRAQAVLANAIIVSDNWTYEKYWLAMLLKVIDASSPPVRDIQSLIGEEIRRVRTRITAEPETSEWHRQSRLLMDQAQCLAAEAYEGAISRPTRHRALPDAQSLWQGWRAARQAISTIVILD